MRANTNSQLSDAPEARTIRFLPLPIVGIFALAIGLFADRPANNGLAGPAFAGSFVTQGQGNYIDEEEEKAYRAALKEPDPQKRAEQMFAFYQKYPNSPLMTAEDFASIKPFEEENSAYYAATQEPDPEKRGALLIEFLQKHPDSKLNVYIRQEYAKALDQASQSKKYESLESLSEKWLKLYPDNPETYAYLAEATLKLQKHERYAQSLEAIYAGKPSPDLAKEIFASYQKTENRNKQKEWAEKLFSMPEFAADYMLRFNYVTQFLADKNYPKAAEYAQLTLKALDQADKTAAHTEPQRQKIRRASHQVIATDLMEKGNFSEAIAAFKNAIAAEAYDEGYYKIGQCLENLKQIDDAMIYYAKAALMGGEYAERAKTRLELLYKALHNDTLIGIDKVYTKAKEKLGT